MSCLYSCTTMYAWQYVYAFVCVTLRNIACVTLRNIACVRACVRACARACVTLYFVVRGRAIDIPDHYTSLWCFVVGVNISCATQWNQA